MRSMAVSMLVLAALGGCVGVGDEAPPAAPEGTDSPSAPPPEPAAPDPPAEPVAPAASRPMAEHMYEGYITYIVLGLYRAEDPVFFTTDFPEDYGSVLLEMTWDAFLPTNEVLALMIHEEGSATVMIAETSGPSPIRWILTNEDVEGAEAYDVVVYQPMDTGSEAAYVILNQDFTIHVTFFTAEVPEGYSAPA